MPKQNSNTHCQVALAGAKTKLGILRTLIDSEKTGQTDSQEVIFKKLKEK